MDMKEYYDYVARVKKGKYIGYNSQQKYNRKIYELLNSKNQYKTILDAGCGTGEFTADLAKNFPESEVVGVDYSKEMLTLCQSKPENLHLQIGNLLDLPFSDGEFDLTLCLGVMSNIERRNWKTLIKELSRVTKKCVIIQTINKNSPLFLLAKIRQFFRKEKFLFEGTTIKEITGFFSHYGCRLVDILPIYKYRWISLHIILKFIR